MYFLQHGGGLCSLCKSPGTNKSTCPLNPESTNPNPEKHPLAPTRLGKELKKNEIKQIEKTEEKQKYKMQLLPKGTVLYRMDPSIAYRALDRFGKEECKQFLSSKSYLDNKPLLYFFDTVKELPIYYKNKNRNHSPVITSFVLTKDVEIPRIDDVNFLKALEDDLKVEKPWSIPLAGSNNQIRYAFGNNYETNIERYSSPDIDLQIAKLAASKYGGYYAPFFKKLGHMELVLSREILQDSAKMLPPICLIYFYNDDYNEDEKDVCSLLHKCFPEALILELKNYQKTEGLNISEILNLPKLPSITQDQLEDIKQILTNHSIKYL